MANKKNKRQGVRDILLRGVFWRILFIEGVLLIYSLGYRWISEDATSMELFWYSVRIIVLVAIIIVFMMVTLRKFLSEKIIAPLEAISKFNIEIQESMENKDHVNLPDNCPSEIKTIVTSQSKMLETIFNISEDRLRYSQALNAELEKGRILQKNFLPETLPRIQHCDAASYFHSALQLSGDFYDMFELSDNHLGFVVCDVSDKGVGSALYMALIRSLLRVFSGAIDTKDRPDKQQHAGERFKPKDAENAVFLINDYIAKEHSSEGIFATLFFAVINLATGKVYYVNAGHEAGVIIGKNGIKRYLKTTGPAIGLVEGAVYEKGTAQLQKNDILFAYTDGVTDALSESDAFFTRERLLNLIDNDFSDSVYGFLETVQKNLFEFTGNAPQSDDITMLAVKWNPIDDKKDKETSVAGPMAKQSIN